MFTSHDGRGRTSPRRACNESVIASRCCVHGDFSERQTERQGVRREWISRRPLMSAAVLVGFWSLPGCAWDYDAQLSAYEREEAILSGATPSARDGHSAVWDEASQSMLVFGGSDGISSNNAELFARAAAVGAGRAPARRRPGTCRPQEDGRRTRIAYRTSRTC